LKATEILASNGSQTLLCGIAMALGTIGIGTSAIAETELEEVPEMEFLEYLGIWEESDEDWLLLDEEEVAENDKRRDPVPEGEDSTESEDER
jgi:hypothetical protein